MSGCEKQRYIAYCGFVGCALVVRSNRANGISSMFRPRFTESRQKLLTVSLVVSLQRAPGAVELPYCRRFKENLCRTGFQIKGLSRIYSKYLNNKLDHFLKQAGYIENRVSDLYNPPIM